VAVLLLVRHGVAAIVDKPVGRHEVDAVEVLPVAGQITWPRVFSRPSSTSLGWAVTP